MAAKFVLAMFAIMALGCSLTGEAATATVPVIQPSPTSQSTGQVIKLQAGAATVRGQLAAHATDQWVVNGQSGQSLSVKLGFTSGTAALAIKDRNGKFLLDETAHVTTFSTTLASTQDYQINVVAGDQSTTYTLTATLQNAAGQTAKPIQIPAGATSATVSGQVAANGVDYWIVTAKAGQTLSVSVTASGGQVGLTMSGADGSLPPQDSPTSFKNVATTAQDYNIHVVGNPSTSVNYTLTVDLK